jgi:hypothetical protein
MVDNIYKACKGFGTDEMRLIKVRIPSIIKSCFSCRGSSMFISLVTFPANSMYNDVASTTIYFPHNVLPITLSSLLTLSSGASSDDTRTACSIGVAIPRSARGERT